MLSKPTAVLFDLDGVLADNGPRLDAFLQECEARNEEPDWNAWYATLPEDDSRPEYVALARMALEAGHALLVVTARPERLRDSTHEWLKFHVPVKIERLAMWNPSYPFHEAKRIELLDLMCDYEIVLAFDDSEHWVKLFREYGIPTIYINEGCQCFSRATHDEIAQASVR